MCAALNYICCLSDAESKAVNAAIADPCGKPWPMLSLQFSHVTYEYNKPQHYSICAQLTAKDEAKMQAFVRGFEKCLESKGVPITVPRAHQWSFHVTLGQVKSDDGYAGTAAVAEVNKLDWSTATAELHQPHCDCRKCRPACSLWKRRG